MSMARHEWEAAEAEGDAPIEGDLEIRWCSVCEFEFDVERGDTKCPGCGTEETEEL